MRLSILALLFIALFGLGSTGCTGFDLLNAPVCGCGYVRTANIAYGNQPRQSLDVYRPREAALNVRVVVFFYGGEWSAGKKADYRFAADALVSKGFVVVLPDYRLHPQVTFPAFVEDGAKAVRWAHDNISRFGGDPTHIYLMGHSAGAHIATLLTLDRRYLADVGLDTSVIRGTAGLSGPYYFFPSKEDLATFNMGPNDATPDPRIEPIVFVHRGEPPMLLLHGRDDTTVQPLQARQLAAQIRGVGGEVRLIEYPCRGHEEIAIALDWPFRWLAPVLRDSADFFYQH